MRVIDRLCRLSAVLLVCGGWAQARPLIDVPYITQTRDLCGGAAVEMVLRYWGETAMRSADLQPLVVPGQGIRTGDLADAVRTRGWTSLLLADVPDDPRDRLRQELARGRPLIALIEVAPQTYHYVVLVGATDELVVFHDPARAPFRTESWAAFDRAWRAAGRWMLLVLPPSSRAERPAAATAAQTQTAPRSPCASLVAESVTLAGADAMDAAERGLMAARALCPAEAAPLRELAGLRFLQSRWAEAINLATAALERDAGDRNARETLATSLYLTGEVERALDVWAPLGAPRIDVVSVQGADRTRHPVIVAASGLRAGEQLTADALSRARRRVRAVPSIASANVSYTPGTGGLAQVVIQVAEREVVPMAPIPVIVTVGRAVISESVDVPVIGLTGGGEALRVAARWSDERPHIRASVAVPAPDGVPGVFDSAVSWDRQAYDINAALTRERRRRIEVGWSSWLTGDLRVRVSLANDRFDDTTAFSGGLGVDHRWFGDRVAVFAEAERWWPKSGPRFHALSAGIAARTATSLSTPATWGRVNLSSVPDGAPLALWAGAGTGASRRPLLRAHSLLEDDVVRGEAFGRTLVQATVEHSRPLRFVALGRVSAAAFIDVARAWHRLPPRRSPSIWWVDAGIGLRVPVGTSAIRLDVAHGLRGGGFTASAGWSVIWPD